MSIKHRRVSHRRWEACRQQILTRDGFRCVTCGKAGRLEVDHIDPDGDHWDPDNLQTLCRGCHIDKTRRDMRPAGQRAWMEYMRGHYEN